MEIRPILMNRCALFMYSFYRFMYDLVGFSRSQSNGFLVLLPLLIIVLFSQPLFQALAKPHHYTSQEDLKMLDSLVAMWSAPDTASSGAQLFPFDPNAAELSDLSALGFSLNIGRRILNYRSKGGKFRIKGDLLKIHGVDTGHYQKLIPYIQLPERRETAKVQRAGKKATSIQSRFDLNTADTTQLESVFGIGKRLAMRIWKYREALGGFVDQNQLFEVYKLDSIVAKKLISSTFIKKEFQPRRHDLNSAEKMALAAHPYLTHKMADVIVAYRFQHGKFNSIAELRKLPGIDSATFTRIQPYLIVQE